jgi:DNA anti-recombination protein RmuC
MAMQKSDFDDYQQTMDNRLQELEQRLEERRQKELEQQDDRFKERVDQAVEHLERVMGNLVEDCIRKTTERMEQQLRLRDEKTQVATPAPFNSTAHLLDHSYRVRSQVGPSRETGPPPQMGK